MSSEAFLERAIVAIVILGFSFPVHEFAHAFAAFYLGDNTARYLGRLTLNPVTHFDPIGGTLLAISVMVGGGFGWAKPTPVNPLNLRGGRWGQAIVAAAGPLSNLVLAIAAAIPLRFMLETGTGPEILASVLFIFVQINLLLMLFNLIPVPPLDGGPVLLAFLPPRTAWSLRPILEQYGILILILLIFPVFGGTSVLSVVFQTILDPIFRLLVGL